MKCKDCSQTKCPYRTSDAEQVCYYCYSKKPDNNSIKAGLTQKQLWIADVSVKILASCPYPYMSVDGHRFISAAEYAAIQARTMADKIFD